MGARKSKLGPRRQLRSRVVYVARDRGGLFGNRIELHSKPPLLSDDGEYWMRSGRSNYVALPEHAINGVLVGLKIRRGGVKRIRITWEAVP